MSLRRELVVSFGVQGAGAASVLLATLWLGAALGPEVQGGFSRTKAEIEFVAAFAMFGLPQALFFHVKAGRLPLRRARRWALASALLALPIGAAYAFARHDSASVALSAALLGAAVAACVAHGQLRALLLVREPTVWFNVLTALPQALVLGGVGAAIVAGALSAHAASSRTDMATWIGLFAFAYGVAAALAWRRLRIDADGARPAGHSPLGAGHPDDRSDGPASVGVGRISPGADGADLTGSAAANADRSAAAPALAGWRDLGHYGLAAWLTAALATAAIVVAQRWVDATQGGAALGRFTLAMTLVQVPLTPVAYAAPLLLRRWMEQPGAQAAQRWAGALFAALCGVALAAWLAAPGWPDLGLGAAYAGTTRALALLLVGGAAEAASRMLAVQASAIGLPWIAVRAEAARWSVLGIGALLPLPDGLLPLCAVWAAGAGAAAAVFVGHACAAARAAPRREP